MGDFPQYKAGRVASVVASGCCFNLTNWPQICWHEILSALCERIGMTEIGFAEVEVNYGPIKDQGPSCVLILKESHISIHAWPFYSAVRITVDSCKEYEVSAIMDFVAEKLKPNFMEFRTYTFE